MADACDRVAHGSVLWALLVAAAVIGSPFLVLVLTVSAGVPGLPELFVTFVGLVSFLGLIAVEFVAIASIFVPSWRGIATVSIVAFFVLLILFLAAIGVQQGSW